MAERLGHKRVSVRCIVVATYLKVERAAVADLAKCRTDIRPIHNLRVCVGLCVSIEIFGYLVGVDDLGCAAELAESSADGVTRVGCSQGYMSKIGASAEVLLSELVKELKYLLGARAYASADVPLRITCPHRLDCYLHAVLCKIRDKRTEELKVKSMALVISFVCYSARGDYRVDYRVFAM